MFMYMPVCTCDMWHVDVYMWPVDVTCSVDYLVIRVLHWDVFSGFYMEPTIFTNVEDDMFIAKEESFGPVMIISIFENGLVHSLGEVCDVVYKCSVQSCVRRVKTGWNN